LGAIIDSEFNSMKSNISNYGLSTPDKEWNKIKEDWDTYDLNAYTYFQNKSK
jgi:hypothetical protein